MNNRILDLTRNEGRLHVDLGRVVLDGAEGRLFAIPATELGVVLISSRGLTITPAVFSLFADSGTAVVICDRSYKTRAQMLPLEGHHLHSEVLQLQVEASRPRKKQLWQQVVKAKIRAQADTLEKLGVEAKKLRLLATRVRSGDPENLEAQAARWYWPQVFGDSSFRRRPTGKGLNLKLNYGYGIIRGIVTRAVCSAGLHPSLGLHHKNRYNAFCLVDDLMEPLRPLVDLVVAGCEQVGDNEDALSPASKHHLVDHLTGPWSVGSERRSLFDISGKTASSLVRALREKGGKLVFPQVG